mmetsp:Transcript_119321/g.320262  ORF Transcript_119321/g.320262 Transcript_119321/m.320262 type:complete len:232 (+) Transcript_119321:359-1054(+)
MVRCSCTCSRPKSRDSTTPGWMARRPAGSSTASEAWILYPMPFTFKMMGSFFRFTLQATLKLNGCSSWGVNVTSKLRLESGPTTPLSGLTESASCWPSSRKLDGSMLKLNGMCSLFTRHTESFVAPPSRRSPKLMCGRSKPTRGCSTVPAIKKCSSTLGPTSKNTQNDSFVSTVEGANSKVISNFLPGKIVPRFVRHRRVSSSSDWAAADGLLGASFCQMNSRGSLVGLDT